MSQTERTNLTTSGVACLRNYLVSGLAGVYAQGRDRLQAAGVDTQDCEQANRVNADALLFRARRAMA